MTTTNYELVHAMQQSLPHSHNAMTQLVMALVKVKKSQGKKTLFGRDKGVAAYLNFQKRLREQIAAHVLDGLITPTASSEEIIESILGFMSHFAEAYPNWQDAYAFAYFFFVERKDFAVEFIDSIR